jgi:hypothetical protein
MENFGRDLKTMIANAKKYNREGSMVYRDASILEVSEMAHRLRVIVSIIHDGMLG